MDDCTIQNYLKQLVVVGKAYSRSFYDVRMDTNSTKSATATVMSSIK